MSAPKKLGAAMYIAATALLLILLTMLFDGALEGQRNPNSSPQSAVDDVGQKSIMLQRNRAGHYVLSGAVNGAPVEFLLDTGATDVAIPGDLSKQLALSQGPKMRTFTANGIGTAYATVIDELKVGDIVERNLRASIIPNMPGKQILLGMSFLKRLDFSQRGDTLVLTQPAR